MASLRNYAILDTPNEAAFDDFTVLASRLLDTPIALISLVDERRQWFKSQVGLDACETPREWAFCAHALEQLHVLEVPDALTDTRFANNPLVLGEPSIRFYAGAPLATPDGAVLGTLCVIDSKPRQLTDLERDTLTRLARQVVHLLELRRVSVLLNNNEVLWRRLFNASAEPSWLLEGQRFIDCNQAAVDEMGYQSKALLLAAHPNALSPPLQLDGQASLVLGETLLERARQEGQIRFAWQLQRADGSTFPAEVTLTRFDEANRSLLCAQWRNVERQQQHQQRLEHQASHDTLTGLPNRGLLGQRLAQALSLSRRHDHTGALLFVDLDHFKQINDVHGHAVGDALLMAVAKRLQGLLRAEDTLARVGGDEMLVLLPELGANLTQARAQAALTAQKLMAALSRPFELPQCTLTVQASLGGTVFPKTPEETPDDLVKESDKAMYQAKAQGRGQYRQHPTAPQ